MLSYFVKSIYLSYSIILSCAFFTMQLNGVDDIQSNNIQSELEVFMPDEKKIEQEGELNYSNPSHHDNIIEDNQSSVIKEVLDNGLTILVRESHEIPKVSFQIWYNVGSKDELIGEKGIAHLIEHMIFKGTDTLSESDINTIVHKLSGTCNAFTSYDYTGYYFNFPTHHWRQAFSIVADCMTNCLFKDDMLNSEMKAVIQELKLYKDQYERALLEELMGMVFADHPYHYPIIGYKQDLWSVTGKDLLAFYKKHYQPNNATLIIVGDVNAAEVVALAKQYFGAIPKKEDYFKKKNFFHRDILSKSLTLYRDIAHPTLAYAFVVPGAIEKKGTALDIFEWIVGKGKSSRLYKKLVNETQLATSIATGSWGLFDHDLFFILVEPKKIENAPEIERIIVQELEDIANNGVADEEFERGFKKTQMSLYSLLEVIEEQGFAIGHAFLATGDENYVFNCLDQPDLLRSQIKDIVASYLRPAIMHKGYVLPLPGPEKDQWALLQEASDSEDKEILDAHIRTSPIEEPVYAQTIEIEQPIPFNFPKPHTSMLSNGLKVFYYDNNNALPKINIVLEFKARPQYDPIDKQGLYTFVTQMMTEGTQNYTNEELAQAIESRGMSLNVYPGGIVMKMLASDFEFGLDLLKEVITHATFPEREIEKVRDQLLTDITQYWDEPRSFINQLVSAEIYKNHPYSKQIIGTKDSIESITRDDLINFYKKYITPFGAHIALVGDLPDENIESILEEKLGNWQSREIEDITYPSLKTVEAKEIKYTINRDQVVLCLAQLSVARKDPKFDAYLLFNQIFGGGILNSMSSRLFDLREHTGLFYTIAGSLLSGVDEEPGIFQVKTIVSRDRLDEAEKAIKNTIDTVVDTLTQEELEEAKRAVINTLVDNFATNSNIASTFLYLERFKLPADYFDNRAAVLEKITLEDMKNAVKDILNSKNMITVKVGRV